MLVKDKDFPTVSEIKALVKEFVALQGEWPLDEWITLDEWDINVWVKGDKPTITVYQCTNHYMGVEIDTLDGLDTTW